MVEMGVSAPWKDGIPYTAMVYKEGSQIVARYGKYGGVLAQGSDAATVIQAAIDAIEKGSLYISNGTYELASVLTIDHFVNIVGAGVRATVLKLANGANCNMIEYNLDATSMAQSQLMFMAHMMLDGNKSNQTSGQHAINTMGGSQPPPDICFFDLWIESYKGNGIYFNSYDWLISHLAIERCDGSGIIFPGATSYGSLRDTLFVDNWYGVYVEGAAEKILIDSCTFSNSRYNGLYAENGEWLLVDHCQFYYNSRIGNNQRSHVWFNNHDRSLVTNSVFRGDGDEKYCFEETGTSDYNHVSGNIFVDAGASGIVSVVGSNTVVADNVGYNPQSASTPVVGASPATFGPYNYPAFITVYGGTVTDISVRSQSTGLTSGSFYLYPGDILTVTYTNVPTVVLYPM